MLLNKISVNKISSPVSSAGFFFTKKETTLVEKSKIGTNGVDASPVSSEAKNAALSNDDAVGVCLRNS